MGREYFAGREILLIEKNAERNSQKLREFPRNPIALFNEIKRGYLEDSNQFH